MGAQSTKASAKVASGGITGKSWADWTEADGIYSNESSIGLSTTGSSSKNVWSSDDKSEQRSDWRGSRDEYPKEEGTQERGAKEEKDSKEAPDMFEALVRGEEAQRRSREEGLKALIREGFASSRNRESLEHAIACRASSKDQKSSESKETLETKLEINDSASMEKGAVGDKRLDRRMVLGKRAEKRGEGSAPAAMDKTVMSALDSSSPAVVETKAEAGDKEAQFLMGCLQARRWHSAIQKGKSKRSAGKHKDGAQQLHSKAMAWFERAARQGHVNAMYSLAQIGLDPSTAGEIQERAVQWLRQAAELENPNAQALLGEMYGKGYASSDGKFWVTRDFQESARWLRLAADAGVVTAQFGLCCLYTEGWGVPKDHSNAKKWLGKAAQNGLELDDKISTTSTHSDRHLLKKLMSSLRE